MTTSTLKLPPEVAAKTFREFVVKNHPTLTQFFDLYKDFINSVAIWQDNMYPIYSMVEEAMEFQNATKLTKYLRGDDPVVDMEQVQKELGDIMFFWLVNVHLHKSVPVDIMLQNVSKLEDRAKRNVIKGDGDTR